MHKDIICKNITVKTYSIMNLNKIKIDVTVA